MELTHKNFFKICNTKIGHKHTYLVVSIVQHLLNILVEITYINTTWSWWKSNNMVCFFKTVKTVSIYVKIIICLQNSLFCWSNLCRPLKGVWWVTSTIHIILTKTCKRCCTIDTTTYEFLSGPILLLYVLKKFLCQQPEDSEKITRKHVGAM
jgi:hypothetical protein